MLDDKLDSALKALILQWNIAERRIKKAEQVRANEVVSSAIFELRYAGRKMVDAFALILEDKWRDDSKVYDRIHAYIADATEDCVKAKHDAIDAMLDFVSSWFKDTEDTLGLGQVHHYFPDYLKITGMISTVQDKITDSRGDRNSLRDSIYDQIEEGDYAEILNLYERMRQSSDRVEQVISHDWWHDFIFGWGGLIVAVGALIVGIIALFH